MITDVASERRADTVDRLARWEERENQRRYGVWAAPATPVQDSCSNCIHASIHGRWKLVCHNKESQHFGRQVKGVVDHRWLNGEACAAWRGRV